MIFRQYLVKEPGQPELICLRRLKHATPFRGARVKVYRRGFAPDSLVSYAMAMLISRRFSFGPRIFTFLEKFHRRESPRNENAQVFRRWCK